MILIVMPGQTCAEEKKERGERSTCALGESRRADPWNFPLRKHVFTKQLSPTRATVPAVFFHSFRMMDTLTMLYALEADVVWWYPVQIACDIVKVLSPAPETGAHFLASLLREYENVFDVPLCTPFIFRVFLIKMIQERFVPFARALANACNDVANIKELEEGAELWNPITQDRVHMGIRPNKQGNSVFSLAELLQWVLQHGMRSPADNTPLETIDVVCTQGFNQEEVFDLVYRPFAPYVALPHKLEEDILPCLELAASKHTMSMAHANADEAIETISNLSDMPYHKRSAFAMRMIRFFLRWGLTDVLHINTRTVRQVLPTPIIITDDLLHRSYFVNQNMEHVVILHDE